MHKYKIYVFLLFLIGVLSINIVKAHENSLKLIGKVIYLDAGHGGKDSGTIYKNIYEKDINLTLCKLLEKKLSKMGAIVYITRYGDYDLSIPNIDKHKRNDLNKRIELINKSQANIFISIHLNSEPTGIWSGPQVFYNSKNPKNEELAKLMQKELNKDLNGKRKYKKDNSLYLQKNIDIPGILIEVGFLSNQNDRYLLKQDDYKNKVVDTISKGIVNYFK